MANRVIRRFRVSLSTLLVLTAAIGLSLAALTHPNYWWQMSMQCAVVVSVAVCAALAVAGQNVRDRAFPLAFIAAVLVHSYLRLHWTGESPIVTLVLQLLPNGEKTFAQPDQWDSFRFTLPPVVSLLLGIVCGWIAFSAAKPPVDDDVQRP